MDRSKLTELANKKKAAGDELFEKLTVKLQNNDSTFSDKEAKIRELFVICKYYGEALEERDDANAFTYCVRLYRLLRISYRRYPSLSLYMKKKARKVFNLMKSGEKSEVKTTPQAAQLSFSFM